MISKFNTPVEAGVRSGPSRPAGWARTIPGKHPEAAYFVYYYKKTHHKLILCLRKMKASGRFKPYAIISKEAFDASLTGMTLQKRKPNQ